MMKLRLHLLTKLGYYPAQKLYRLFKVSDIKVET